MPMVVLNEKRSILAFFSFIIIGEHKAYVSHLEGPECIYLQLSSSTDMLNEILEKLDVNGPLAEPEVYCPVGQACIGVYSIDGNWYR